MDPYDFQSELIDKLGTPEIVSRLVGDEMGLGKTLEGSFIDYRLRKATYRKGAPTRRTLIVAPLSVHQTWAEHIRNVFPSARICIIDKKNRHLFVKALQKGSYNYFICHYEALRLKDTGPALKGVQWFHVIADEVHRIKNRKAQQTRGMKALRTQFKTGASGTPADNAPQDLWSVLNWLYPKKYSAYWRFVHTFCEEKDVEGKGGATFKQIVGPNKDTVPQLLAEMSPFYMRRLKKDVLKDLPDKYYTQRWVELSPAQRRVYDQMKKDMIAWIGEQEDTPLTAGIVVAQLVRLQQFALATPEISYKTVHKRPTPAQKALGRPGDEYEQMVVNLVEPSSKLDDLEEILDDNPTEQFIVFSQSRHMVDLVAQRLVRNKISVGRYTGAVRNQQTRDATVEAFQRGDLRVFAGTIAAGGESITLTAASTVVFLDRHWSPAKNNQAEDRAHRIGQKDAVQVIDIMARNTVDLGRHAKIATKWAHLQYLLGDTVDPDVYAAAVQRFGALQDPLVEEAANDALAIFGGF
jgi:SNF2 family DNA or RNA helicase